VIICHEYQSTHAQGADNVTAPQKIDYIIFRFQRTLWPWNSEHNGFEALSLVGSGEHGIMALGDWQTGGKKIRRYSINETGKKNSKKKRITETRAYHHQFTTLDIRYKCYISWLTTRTTTTRILLWLVVSHKLNW